MADTNDTQDKTLEGHAADLGELITEREREESSSVRDNQKLAELKREIERREKLLRRVLNESPTSTTKRPHLRVVN